MTRLITFYIFKGTYGEISWDDNFITFMDSMAQILIIHLVSRELVIPTFIRKVVIDFKQHFKILKDLNQEDPSNLTIETIQI